MASFKIQGLRMMNWGPFYPNKEMIICFSTDDIKNVTYIHGKNGSGKTFCFQALKWALFPDNIIEHIDISDKSDLREICSNIAKMKSDCQEIEMYVMVIFEFCNPESIIYLVKRKITFICNDKQEWEMGTESFFCQIKYPDGEIQEKKKDEYLALMKSVFPEGPRNYFFLDGEKMEHNFRYENMQKVKEFAYALSPLKKLEIIKDLLENGYKKRVDNRNTRARNALDKRNKAKTDLKKNVDELETKIKALESKINNLHNEESALIKTIPDLEDRIKDGLLRVPSLVSKKDSKQKDYDTFEQEYTRSNNLLTEKLPHVLPFLLVRDKITRCVDDLQHQRDIGNLPKIIDKNILLQSIKSKKCVICGRPLDEVCIDYIKKLEPKTASTQETYFIRDFEENIKKINDSLDAKRDEIKNIYKALIQYDKKRKELLIEINNLKTEISKYTSNPDVWQENYTKLNDSNSRLTNIKNEIKSKSNELETLNSEFLEKKSKWEESSGALNNARYKHLEEIENRRKKLVKFIVEMVAYIQERINQSIEELTFERWKLLIEDPEIWSTIKIIEQGDNAAWKISPFKKGMQNSPVPSQGQRHILGISFLTALSSLFEAKYPLIFDSPFGRVDPQPVKNIGNNLPMILKGSQIILFVTDTEDIAMRDNIENLTNSMQKNIGKQWSLEKMTEDPITRTLLNYTDIVEN